MCLKMSRNHLESSRNSPKNKTETEKLVFNLWISSLGRILTDSPNLNLYHRIRNQILRIVGHRKRGLSIKI